MVLLSTAMTAPHVLRAQQRGNSLIGILDATSGPHQSNLAAFREGLEDAGCARGLVPIEYRWRDSSFDRLPALAAHSLPALAADLVSSNVDVIVTGDFNGLRAVRAATTSIPIPIVFFGGSDLVAGGLIESLDRPGANVTGITILSNETSVKQIEMPGSTIANGFSFTSRPKAASIADMPPLMSHAPRP